MFARRMAFSAEDCIFIKSQWSVEVNQKVLNRFSQLYSGKHVPNFKTTD